MQFACADYYFYLLVLEDKISLNPSLQKTILTIVGNQIMFLREAKGHGENCVQVIRIDHINGIVLVRKKMCLRKVILG